ncbi:MAG: respiratory nitrate reductase subunit gamma [Actinomycetales bacterium]|nr:respiratory nitrate reductase subunit gamma [Actinomycetales bacterium]
MSTLDIALWGVLPYLVAVLFVGGLIWRWRYDQFGWTTRSSQLYESALLRFGSPVFHFGILVVLVGHIIGLLVPKSWTETLGMSQETYHVQALVLGGVAGVCTLAGIVLLVYRRRTRGPVFMATTWNDKIMYLVLAAAIVAGLAVTLLGAGATGEGHDYRTTVSPWFRSLFVLRPDVEAMTHADTAFHVHVLFGLTLFAIWPFTRLVHAFSAPIGYLFRPYIVYRRRRPALSSPASRAPRPGWGADRRQRLRR